MISVSCSYFKKENQNRNSGNWKERKGQKSKQGNTKKESGPNPGSNRRPLTYCRETLPKARILPLNYQACNAEFARTRQLCLVDGMKALIQYYTPCSAVKLR
jgi:hypothetical protein